MLRFPIASSPARWRWAQPLAAALACLCVGAAAARLGLGPLGVFLCAACVLSLVFAHRAPAWGLAVFVATACGLPRYGKANAALSSLGLLNWIAALLLTGCAVWMVQNRRPLQLSAWPLRVMALFLAWGAVSLGFASSELQAQAYDARHHPEQFVQAGVLMLVASQVLGVRAAGWWFALLLGGVVAARVLLQGDAIYLDGDIAALAVMALPFALLSVTLSQPASLRLALAGVACGLAAVVLAAQNRGAALGLALALSMLWLNARRRGLWLGAAVLSLLVLASCAPGDYVNRFRVLWDPAASHRTAGLDRATVEQRTQLWEAGFRAFKDHPWLGAGPGNDFKVLGAYFKRSDALPAHNSVLSVAVETGAVGALLYALLFAGGIVHLQRRIRQGPPGWQRDTRRMLQASLAAYLGVGLVLSRHDMQLAYLLLGWTVALAATASADRPDAPTP